MSQTSTPTSTTAVSVELVRSLAVYAGLPLPKDRETAVAATLGVWVTDANALSTKMASAEYQHLVPAAVFVHPDAGDGVAA